uniref:Conserved oligomeric Golgi complex subunit 8 n=1 Tax=Clastoptera arizonana TaxID=38151 RepID=A0A1B6DKQ7_9HEMI
MDLEEDNITPLIFPEGLKEEWKLNPNFYSYLSKLGGYSVEELSKEPDRLAEEKAAVLNQTQELAFLNYKTFIRTAECSREISEQFEKAESSLNSLVDGIPKLLTRCEEFVQASNDIKTKRYLNTLTLTRNAQLLQVLEIPQLMETCIRDGHYEEALQLAAYVRRLANKHGDIPIIDSIVKEVDAAWWSLMHQLISQLRTDLQLPRCLQVVGYLRWMEIFTEAELRLKFLQARDAWLQKLLSEIPTDDVTQHLTKTIELSRVHLFNIITQYKAVFTDDEHVITGKQLTLGDATVFYSWINEKISQFITTLEEDLKQGVGSSLSSLLGQCMYFGLSFSRVGADFRALIAPIFIKTVTNNFENGVRNSTKKFESDMEKLTLGKNLSTLTQTAKTSQSTKQEHPPETLVEFYPLAEYCNNLVTALNDLRLCAPLAVADNISNCLKESLTSSAKTILSFYRQEQQALNSAEKEAFTRFCVCFGEQLVPYIQRCLHSIFKPADIAAHFGISTFQLLQQGFTVLGEESILDPIKHLMPGSMDG